MDSALGLCFFMLVFWMPITLSQQDLPSCNIKFDCSPSPGKIYSVHGDFVPVMFGKAFFIENQTTADCSLNLTRLLQHCYPDPPATLSHLALGMKCSKRRHLVFQKPKLTDYDNVLLMIQIHNCKLSLDDIDWIGTVANLRVFIAVNTEIIPSILADSYNHSYSGLQKIVSLSVLNSNSTNRLETFFPRPDVFKSMAEVQFHNMSIDRLPSDFTSRMPTLQSLDLLNNNLTVPPSFPWYEGDRRLPLNLTRTKVFNDRYTTLLGIHLHSSLFRRVFHLGNNRIVTLRGYNFTGRIQIITLPGNQLREFGEDVLAQVTGLEQLDLSRNNLTYVSPIALNHPGLVGLKGINLRGNQLESLDNNTFETVTHLTKVDLAYNKLTILRKGTFSMLLKLEVLHLENNQLAYIESGCFPDDVTTLKHLILSNNLFTHIPADLFSQGHFDMIDLSGCHVSLNNLNETLTQVSIARLQDTSSRVRSVILRGRNNFKKTHPYQKVINLKNNNVTRVPVYPNLPQFKLLLVYVKLQLEDNPIDCSGSMSDFIMYMTDELQKDNFDRTEYLFKDIRCARPLEFANKPVLSLDPTTLFYLSHHSNCPSQCVCYQFVSRDEYMVNCSASRLISFPMDLPPRTVDLRLQHNNITTLHTSASLTELRKLDISFNKISQIDADFFQMSPGLKYLNLKHNFLGRLPKSIRSLSFQELDISENHFLCDCKMIWVKPWLFDNKINIINWNKLTCTYGSNTSAILKVSDKDFICLGSTDWKLYLAIAVGVVLLVFLAGFILIYRFRFDIKALLFVRFNVKIFEKKVVIAPDVALDMFILCSQRDNQWTEENIYKTLNSSVMLGSVALCRNDVLVGLTMEENFDLMVDNSSKVVVVLSEDFFVDPLCVSGLEKAVRMSLRMRTKSVVIVELKAYLSSSVKSACVRRFLRTQKTIKPADKLFREKIVYSVARKHLKVNSREEGTPREDGQTTHHWESRLYSRLPSTTSPYIHDLYLSCSDSDLTWARNNVSGKLEEQGHNICIPARDFIPGMPIDTQIVETLATSRHVLLIISNNSMDNFQSFVFRMASQTSVKEHRNYLLVILLKDTVIEKLGEKEQAYLNTHAFLRERDALWWEKLMRSISSERQNKSAASITSQTVDPEQLNVCMEDDTTLQHSPDL